MKRYKPNKQLFYLKNFSQLLIPRCFFTRRLSNCLSDLQQRKDKEYIWERVNYYNKLSSAFKLPQEALTLKELSLKNARTMYFLDAYHVSRWFPDNLRWSTAFGDINYVCLSPSITKSRPISQNNQNNVLLKLNRYRHFNFIHDPYTFSNKINKAVFRADIGDSEKQNRVEFMKLYFGSEFCNCGSIRNMPELPEEWLTSKLPIGEQLKYKYILALEGNDVATNLKWIMSSNSIAIMPQPTCETWFMEGKLIPDYHYIEIKPDFSNLKEKMEYFTAHPKEAENIIAHAHEYCEQFMNKSREDLIGLLVLQKYFELSGQI